MTATPITLSSGSAALPPGSAATDRRRETRKADAAVDVAFAWIVASDDMGVTWNIEATDFHFFRGRLSSPRFINAGQGYKDAPDPEHIYAVFVGTETNKAFFEQNDAIWLGRVPTAQLLNRTWRALCSSSMQT